MTYEEIITQIKQDNSIVELVSQYVELTKKGNNYWGLCPFHEDSNPSFSVNEDKGFYYCFSCRAGGDILDFLQHQEKIGLEDAIKYFLGESVDIKKLRATRKIPKIKIREYQEKNVIKAMLFGMGHHSKFNPKDFKNDACRLIYELGLKSGWEGRKIITEIPLAGMGDEDLTDEMFSIVAHSVMYDIEIPGIKIDNPVFTKYTDKDLEQIAYGWRLNELKDKVEDAEQMRTYLHLKESISVG